MTKQQSEINSTFINKNKRIAKNTTLMFLRMLVLTIINLYTVRLVLKGLGFVDYGIFNAVAGVVTAAGFVSGVLALSIQRFFSISLGKAHPHQLQEIFSASVNIIIILCGIIFLLFETIGLWFLYTQMTIPSSRMVATLWLYQYSIFIFIFSLLQIPYTAAIFSHEDMGTYAFISTIDSTLRLIIAAFIYKIAFDHLEFYGFMLLLESICIFGLYKWEGKKYPECHYKKNKNKGLYHHLLNFSGWTMFGSLANMGMNQGSTILLNIFFGPISNMAFGIAMQISNALNALCNSMVLSFRPAMIRAYASKEFDYVNQLFNNSNKFIYYILLCVALPLIAEMNFILKIWLGNINTETILFARLIIIYIVLLAISNPITIIMQASGYVKEYHLPVESITLLCLPITWLLFNLGYPACTILDTMIFTCIIAHIIRLFCLKHFYKTFSIQQYLFNFIVPAFLITIFNAFIEYILYLYITNNIIRFFTIIIIIPLLTLLSVYILGISRKEKIMLKKFIIGFIKKKLCQK